MTDYIITVMARDRVGIVRDVTNAITGIEGNITHLSQTVMRGYFTLIISAEMPDARTQLEVRQAIERAGRADEFEVSVRPYVEQSVADAPFSERFTLSMQGRDQKGIIARATSHLASQDINIDDFYCYVHDDTLLMLAQVAIPAGCDVDGVQAGLAEVGREFGLIVHLQHEDIFRATSDIRPVIHLNRGAK